MSSAAAMTFMLSLILAIPLAGIILASLAVVIFRMTKRLC